jgi:tRNA-specific 2-thiouridylase
VSKRRPGAAAPGDVVDEAGRVLGTHPGVIHFTVGQRRGLGVAAAEPLYVLRLEPEARRVVVGPRAALATRRVAVAGINWLGPTPPRDGLPVGVKLRSAQPPVKARFHLDDGSGGEALLDEPAFGVAAGQACVVYDGTRVLGGGWIRRTDAKAAPAAIA